MPRSRAVLGVSAGSKLGPIAGLSGLNGSLRQVLAFSCAYDERRQSGTGTERSETVATS